MVARALSKGVFDLELVDVREFGESNHKTVDDYPYGGGPGMLLKPEPISKAILKATSRNKKGKVIFLTANGIPFSQGLAGTLSKHEGLIFVCGRYEGIDERVSEVFAHYRISLGPFVLNGGELAALAISESVIRLLPGFMGNEKSVDSESFMDFVTFEPPRYTRPDCFLGLKVPEYLLSGNHDLINAESRRLGQQLRSETLSNPLNKT